MNLLILFAFLLFLNFNFASSACVCTECACDLTSCDTILINSSIYFSSDVCFNIFNLENKSLQCNGNEIIGNNGGIAFNISNSQNFTIKDCQIENVNVALFISNSSLLKIENIRLNNLVGSIDESISIYLHNSKDTILNNISLLFTKNGLAFEQSSNISLSNINVTDVEGLGFYALELNNSNINNFSITGSNSQHFCFAILNSSSLNISSLNLKECSSIGMYLENIERLKLQNLSLDNIEGHAALFFSNISNSIFNNLFLFFLFNNGILIDKSTNVSLSNINVTDVEGLGFYALELNNSNINNFSITESNQQHFCFAILNSSSLNISSLNIKKCNSAAVFFENLVNITLINSILHSNKTLECSNSSNITIFNNIFNSNTTPYIGINNCQNLSFNTTLRNGTNIINGTKIGGNVYLLYNNSGFSQTCSDANADGICDSNHTLAPGVIDFYPLSYFSNLSFHQLPNYSIHRGSSIIVNIILNNTRNAFADNLTILINCSSNLICQNITSLPQNIPPYNYSNFSLNISAPNNYSPGVAQVILFAIDSSGKNATLSFNVFVYLCGNGVCEQGESCNSSCSDCCPQSGGGSGGGGGFGGGTGETTSGRKECSKDSDCGKCKYCKLGTCVIDIREDGKCQDRTCKQDPDCKKECIKNSECPSGKICYNGKCTEPCDLNFVCIPSCTSDPDCLNINKNMKVCTSKDIRCCENILCEGDNVCINNKCLNCKKDKVCNPSCGSADVDCYCVDDRECGDGKCFDGMCVLCIKDNWCNPFCPPFKDLDCYPEKCKQDGICDPICQDDVDCCIHGNNVCGVNCTAQTDDDCCGEDFICNKKCKNDIDCVEEKRGCLFNASLCGDCAVCKNNLCVPLISSYYLDVPLQIEINKKVSAILKDAKSGERISDVKIIVIYPSGKEVEIQTDKNGEIHFIPNEEGGYSFSLKCEEATLVRSGVLFAYSKDTLPGTKTIKFSFNIDEEKFLTLRTFSEGLEVESIIFISTPSKRIIKEKTKNGVFTITLKERGLYKVEITSDNVKTLSSTYEFSEVKKEDSDSFILWISLGLPFIIGIMIFALIVIFYFLKDLIQFK